MTERRSRYPDSGRCQGTTAEGRCILKARPSGYCWQHEGHARGAGPCGAPTRNAFGRPGKPCTVRAGQDGLCAEHRREKRARELRRPRGAL